jgi:hypothetical protein
MKYLLCTKFRTLIAYTYHCPGDGMLDHFNLQEVVLDGFKLNVIPNEECSVENGCTDIWQSLHSHSLLWSLFTIFPLCN